MTYLIAILLCLIGYYTWDAYKDEQRRRLKEEHYILLLEKANDESRARQVAELKGR